MRSGRVHGDESHVAQQGGRSEEGRLIGDMAEKQGRCRLPAADRQGNVRRNRRVLLFLCDQGQRGPCYHCNWYGHKQALCTSHIRCAICSKGHRRDDCTNRTAQSVRRVAKGTPSSNGRAFCILNTGDTLGSRRLRGHELRVTLPQTWEWKWNTKALQTVTCDVSTTESGFI